MSKLKAVKLYNVHVAAEEGAKWLTPKGELSVATLKAMTSLLSELGQIDGFPLMELAEWFESDDHTEGLGDMLRIFMVQNDNIQPYCTSCSMQCKVMSLPGRYPEGLSRCCDAPLHWQDDDFEPVHIPADMLVHGLNAPSSEKKLRTNLTGEED